MNVLTLTHYYRRTPPLNHMSWRGTMFGVSEFGRQDQLYPLLQHFWQLVEAQQWRLTTLQIIIRIALEMGSQRKFC